MGVGWAAILALVVVCSFLLVYPYVGYPLILSRMPERRVNSGLREAGSGANYSIVFCAYNEAATIAAKIENLRELRTRYPELHVLAYDDNSSDGTPETIESTAPWIRLVRGTERKGKAHGMKCLVGLVDTEFIVFSDANVMVDGGALDCLERYYADPLVGGVCGTLRYRDASASATAATGGMYWRLEERLKDRESRVGSVMGADGSIFSVRKKLYPEYPDTVQDDFVVSMEVVFRGYRLIKANDVIAYERLVKDSADELLRKVRIATRAYHSH